MTSPAIQHSLSCFYRELGTDERIYSKYFDGTAFKAVSDSCTHLQANIGSVYVGVIIGLIAFCIFAIRDREGVQECVADGQTARIVGEFFLNIFVSGVIGVGGTMAVAFMFFAWAPVLGVIISLVALYGLYRLLAGYDWLTSIKSIASKVSLNAHLTKKQRRLETELEKLRSDPLYLEAERRLEAELATDSLTNDFKHLKSNS
jgi:hypothetical protein